MPTEIMFSGGQSIVVDETLEVVRRNVEETGVGRPLLRYQLAGKRDAAGNLAEVYVNWVPSRTSGSCRSGVGDPSSREAAARR